MKKNINLSIIDGVRTDFEMPTEKIRNGKYVSWGAKNTFPQYLYDLYYTCPFHQAIIDGLTGFVYGQGIDVSDAIINEDGDRLSDLVKKSITDYLIFGGFCVQKYRTRGGGSSYQWVDIQNVRLDSDITKAFYNPDWQKQGYKSINNLKTYDLVKKPEDREGIIFYRGTRTRGIYPVPSYIAALTDLEIQKEISNFHLNSIKNNFTANLLINFIEEDLESLTDEVKDAVEEKLIEKFSGSNNASKFLIEWVRNKDQSTVITRLDDDNADEKFQTLAKYTKENIFVAHRITSACLFGVSTEGKGFSQAEYQEAFTILNNTLVTEIQQNIEDAFRKYLGIELNFKKFEYDTVDKANQE